LEYRFERYFRDVHFLTKHASKSVERVTSVGRMLLGMPPGWPALEI
jgi:alkylation response protein AidB-like acyl-CoA dehydrogenase